MTTAQLYKRHLEGKISKGKFLQEVRNNPELPYITNLNSYEDAVNMLKQKSVIKEAQAMTIEQIIDRLNPYWFKAAFEFELSKVKGEITPEKRESVKAKVAKKLQKDPTAYQDLIFSNSKEVDKRDKKLEMEPVKKANFKDKDNEMKKPKGYQADKKNTSTSTKENKKGKPKGVKEMRGSSKKPKGVSKVMEPQGKEKIVEAIAKYLVENSVIPTERTDYSVGHKISTPGGSAIVKEKHGSIVEVELEKDGAKQVYTLNVLDKHNAANRFEDEPKPQDVDKAERDQMWSDWDKQGHKPFDTVQATPMSTQDLLKKLKMVVEKLKLKKEAAELVMYKDATGTKQVAGVFKSGQGKKQAQELKRKGVTSATVDKAM